MGADGFVIDHVGLRRLSDQLRMVRDELTAHNADRALAAPFSHPDLKMRLGQFVDNWSDAKTRIADQLGELAELTGQAAEQYRVTDENVAQEYRS
jgi:hypothetical protein